MTAHRLVSRPAPLPRLPQVTPTALADLVRTVAHDVLADRGLHRAVLPAAVTVERPRRQQHGDYATAVALHTSGVSPQEFAGWLAEALRAADVVSSAEAAGPGFVNLRLTAGAQPALVTDILAAGDRYGLAGAPPRIEPQRDTVRTGAGAVLTMAELVEVLGADAARYALIRGKARVDSRIDIERWSRRTDDNPLFVVQYAHSRLASIARNAPELGVTAEPGPLRDEREHELIRLLGEFGDVVSSAAQRREPHRVVRYLERLADTSHDISGVLPMGDEQPAPRHAARLAVCHATRQVLANGLRLLGISAPERM